MSAIIPVEIAQFITCNGNYVDPCTTSRRKLVNAIRNAFYEGNVIDYNNKPVSAKIKELVLSYSSKQFRILNVKPSNKSYKPIVAKLSNSIEYEQQMSISGINSDGSELVIYLFQANYPAYNIYKGDVFLDARIVEPFRKSIIMDICIFIQILLEYVFVLVVLFLLYSWVKNYVTTDSFQLRHNTIETYQNMVVKAYQNMASKVDLSFLETLKSQVANVDFSYFGYLRNAKMVSDLVCYFRGNKENCKK